MLEAELSASNGKTVPFHLIFPCMSESPQLAGPQEKAQAKTARKEQKAGLSQVRLGEEGFGKGIRVEGEALA